MSFGFLTESALLPAKSKPIKIDGRSLVDLKAVVYAKEQKVKKDASSASGLRGLRGKRSAPGGEGREATGRKDVFARSNKGVEDRSERDELERVTQSKKRKAGERNLAAKSKLYEKMARGELGDSRAGSLVDFSRKTASDLALLEAKASSSKAHDKRQKKGDEKTNLSKRRNNPSEDNDDDDAEEEQQRNNYESGSSHGFRRETGSGNDDEDDHDEDDDPTSAEVNIIDEFGRERLVPRGGKQHLAYLEAKRAENERKALQKSEAEAFDERYSYRGNRGAPPIPEGAGVGGSSGGWAWSSGHGRGADSGDFETREGQESRAAKEMAELMRQHGGGQGMGKDESRAKILSQWEKTLTGDQKAFLREVQEEAEASRRRSREEKPDGRKLRQERKELLRRKQEARAEAARLRGDTKK